jgi:hypothetical protein
LFQLHPDRAQGGSIEENKEKLLRVMSAYRILTSKEGFDKFHSTPDYNAYRTSRSQVEYEWIRRQQKQSAGYTGYWESQNQWRSEQHDSTHAGWREDMEDVATKWAIDTKTRNFILAMWVTGIGAYLAYDFDDYLSNWARPGGKLAQQEMARMQQIRQARSSE